MGFFYLTAIMDVASRKVLAWQLSNTLTTDFCLAALGGCAATYTALPEIFNTDQGSQFTSEAFTGRLKKDGIQISMDGKGRWPDNVFVERLWRSLKYEHIYLMPTGTAPRGTTAAHKVLRLVRWPARPSVARLPHAR